MREMKDSGIEWIGDIPVEWNIIKNKYLITMLYSGGTPSATNENFYCQKNGIPFVSISDMSNCPYVTTTKKQITEYGIKDKQLRILPKGTVLYSIYATVGAISELKIEATISQAMLAIQVNSKIDKSFYKYNLIAMRDYIFSNANGNTQYNLNAEKVRNFYFVFPLLDIQQKISSYLDYKCTRIDTIIEKQQKIIEKLKAYKLSLITETVTKGLNPDVKMKDSGNVWFSSIPINWELEKIKYIFSIKKDIANQDGLTVLSITQKGIRPKNMRNNGGQWAESYVNYQKVNKGDFAMNHMDLLTGWVDISDYNGVTSPDYRVFVLNDKQNYFPKYYLYFMQMCYMDKIFYGLGQGVSGVGRWRLQADKFLNFHIPIPPYSEQTLIAEYLDKKCSAIDCTIAKKQALIEKLTEYKKSLIYEVVTGKKEF